MKYIKELDTIRALAILSVIANHWFPQGSTLHHLSNSVEAPNIFFTLSGFLVTKILLSDRLKATKQVLSYQSVYKRFFIKRALRIFPAYYLTILLAYILKPDSLMSSECLSYLTFTSNFHVYHHQNWGYLSHLWSMAVEQQFYLLWPFLILLGNKNHLPFLISLLVVMCVLSQQIVPHNDYSHVLPHTVLDTLGLGALLAWLITFKPHWLRRVHKLLLLIGVVSVVLIVCLGMGIGESHIFVHNRTLVALVTVALIAHFVVMNDRVTYPFSFLFRNKQLIFIGKISYGIYLYHLTLLTYSYRLLNPINIYLPRAFANSQYVYLAECLVLVIGLAWLSWRYVELPISNLKKYVSIPSVTHADIR